MVRKRSSYPVPGILCIMRVVTSPLWIGRLSFAWLTVSQQKCAPFEQSKHKNKRIPDHLPQYSRYLHLIQSVMSWHICITFQRGLGHIRTGRARSTRNGMVKQWEWCGSMVKKWLMTFEWFLSHHLAVNSPPQILLLNGTKRFFTWKEPEWKWCNSLRLTSIIVL